MNLICNIYSKITLLKSQAHLPGTNEFMILNMLPVTKWHHSIWLQLRACNISYSETKRCHIDNLFVTGCTCGCQNDLLVSVYPFQWHHKGTTKCLFSPAKQLFVHKIFHASNKDITKDLHYSSSLCQESTRDQNNPQTNGNNANATSIFMI